MPARRNKERQSHAARLWQPERWTSLSIYTHGAISKMASLLLLLLLLPEINAISWMKNANRWFHTMWPQKTQSNDSANKAPVVGKGAA
jgi:hypothetical protein